MVLSRMMCTLSALTTLTAVEATPDIQLAGFDDLFKLATAGWSGQDLMEDRADRSLVNSNPFNQVPRGSPADTSHSHHAQPSGHQSGLTSSSSVISARTQASKSSALGSALFHPSSADIQSQVHSTYSNIKSQAAGSASSFNLGRQSSTHAQAGLTLLAGYGSQSQQTFQEQQLSSALSQASSAASSAYSAAQAPVHNQFANFPLSAPAAPEVHYPTNDAVIVSDSFLSQGASQCPAAPSIPIQQCQEAVNACWSFGVGDVDCPGHGLCCFDGCANVCYGEARAVARPALRPAATFVNPNRRRQPAQKRRQPAGETFEDVAAAGQRCIDKIEQVEEIEYDELEECHHSYDKKCHTSYSTEYESQQEEECEDNYKKDCDITYSPQAQNVTVRVCMTPLVKDCNLAGPEVCRTEYISECWTKNDPHIVTDDVPQCRTEYEEKCVEKQSGYVTEEECSKWPREVCTVRKELKAKFNPVTKCEKVPQELCGPSGCGFVPGPEECHDQTKTVITDIPNEICDLQPQRKCAHVTKLVPKLTPVEECVDVPKEVCQKTKGNPRTVLKPVTKKWCYTPTQESGLV